MTRRFLRLRPTWPLVLSSVCVLASMASIAQGAEITLVVPNAYADQEGPSYVYGAVNDYRYQEVMHASEFGALTGGNNWLTKISWRPDQNTPDGFVESCNGIEMRMSVTQQSPNTISTTFANNITGPETVIYNGPWSATTQSVDLPNGTKKFDFDVVLTTPFRYDPSEGNLLTDVRGTGTTIAYSDLVLSRSAAMVHIDSGNGGINSPFAVPNVYLGGLIWEFTFVPLPGDYNHDAVVNNLDYDTWKAAFGLNVGAYAGADGNGNGIVDAADYTVWRDNLGHTAGSGVGTLASAISDSGIPEPNTLVLAVLAAAGVVGLRRRILVVRTAG